MISVVYSCLQWRYYAYMPDLVTYEITGWQCSKDNSFSITRRQGHRSVLTRYGRFQYLQLFQLQPTTSVLPTWISIIHIPYKYIVCAFKLSRMMSSPIDTSGGVSSSQVCEPDQTLFVQGAYTASDNTPAQKQGLAT